MKKLFLFSMLSLFFATSFAQVDRTKQPEPGPAPEINLQEPVTFSLKNGLKVMVVENHKLPRVSIQLTLDNPPVLEGEKAGVQSLAGSLMGNGSKSISKDDFNEEVDFLGARLNFGATSAFASSLSKYFPRILELMADAALNPNFTQEEFEKEKAKLITGLKTQENDVSAIASRVQSALAYGKNHPRGEFTTEQTVNNVSLLDVENFYRDYFVPANAYLVVIGDIEFDQVKELVTKNFTPWTKAVPPSLSYSEPKDAQYTQINFVDMPNAVQSEISVQNLVDLKMKDEDYLDALIANRILGGGAQARLFLNLREDKGYTYGSYSGIGNNKFGPSTFRATASVRNMVTDSSVVELLKEIDKISSEPVTAEELANAKAKYVGNFVMALERPQTIANYALNIETEGLPKDFYKTYLERINAVSIDDVQNASKKYFSSSNARVVVTGKGSEVLENLENVKLNGKAVPVLYYDKIAEKAEKPNYDTAVPEGITATSVLEKYIEVIGGKAKLDAVESYAMLAEAEMQGMKLELEMKKTSKEQFMQDVRVMGNSMQKQVIDGDKGYMMAQGQRKDLSEEELKKLKEESAAFPELNYLIAGGITLEGAEAVGDKKAYKLKITDEKTVFYDVETGLKLQEVNNIEAGGQQMQQTLSYDDYKEVSGIKFPFKLVQTMGPQKFDFIVKEIKVNDGVNAADFE
ncbi:pitrilysin family protein [uncultured Croceitalea sp.]|uniref:M16 family metallopeptidase n=1 Tax=uncultured Croceitalea sp. TaxID=1798908 RepID=UPI003305DE49